MMKQLSGMTPRSCAGWACARLPRSRMPQQAHDGERQTHREGGPRDRSTPTPWP